MKGLVFSISELKLASDSNPQYKTSYILVMGQINIQRKRVHVCGHSSLTMKNQPINMEVARLVNDLKAVVIACTTSP